MEFVGLMSGGAPVIKKHQVSASLSRVGIPLLAVAASEAGVNLPSTTDITDMLGCNLDLATYATAQVAGGSPEALCSIILNPDAIWKILMSGGAASGTAEGTLTVTSASTDGLTITTGSEWSSPTYDEGLAWCVSGANAGQKRKVTSVSSTAGTLTVAFAQDIAVGDVFSRAPLYPLSVQTVTLTTELDEFRQDVAVASNTAKFCCIEIDPNAWLGMAGGRPFGLFLAVDHILNREA